MPESIKNLIDKTYAARRANQLSDAHRFAHEALRKSRDNGESDKLALALMAVGQVERDSGRPSTARPLYEEAVGIYRASDDISVLAHAIRHLGDLYQQLNDLALAEKCYDEALAFYRRLEDVSPLSLANTVRPLAILKDKLNQPDDARRLWELARDLYQQVNIQAAVDECTARLAQICEDKS